MLPNPGCHGLLLQRSREMRKPRAWASPGRGSGVERQYWRGLAGQRVRREATADPRQGNAPLQDEAGVKVGNPWGRHPNPLNREAATKARPRAGLFLFDCNGEDATMSVKYDAGHPQRCKSA